jgi:Subunit ChlI of Mg-chelatase
MSVAIVYSRAQVGIEAPLVTIEVHLSNGLPGLSIVGLPEAAVKESKDRVRSLNTQSGPGLCTSDQINDHCMVHQWPPAPVLGDVAEHPMLDLIPLAGTRWEVTHREY